MLKSDNRKSDFQFFGHISTLILTHFRSFFLMKIIGKNVYLDEIYRMVDQTQKC